MTPASLPLLPSNATVLEQELARQSARIDDLDPGVIETIWDAWACPAAILPWLAWALSVDVWEDGWSEIQKRQTIADSPYYHRIKGTRLAVEMALALTNRPFALTEWFDVTPPRRRGTALAYFETEDFTEIARILPLARRYVLSAKPKSRAVFIGAGPVREGPLAIAGALSAAPTIIIEPYRLENENFSGPLGIAAALLSSRSISIGTQP